MLRGGRNTPEDVWELALDCIERGLGYPLIANDEVIVDALREYYGDDAENYGTSACWEPLIPGRSMDQNNLANLNLLIPLEEALRSGCESFDELLEAYRSALGVYVEGVIREIEALEFEPSPPLSLLFPDCIEKCRDIAYGGAAYSYNGVLSVGMGNLVNSLINIKRLCFDEKRMTLDDVIDVLDDNFRSSGALRSELENHGPVYGMDEPLVVDLTNRIIDMIHGELQGRYKFGLSSPSYIWAGEDTGASFDGRRAGEPMGVHISPVKLLEGMSYTGILNFASSLDYSKACNGGVVDIMIDRTLLERIRCEFTGLLRTGLMKGVMQLQVNVLDPQVILEAARDPELHPDLIVRVWGFSAYFRDLPEEYRELIVRRALNTQSTGVGMARLRVTGVQRFSVHDGPGIRTTVFLKGCSLRCPWCCNPENIKPEREVYFRASRCTGCLECLKGCEFLERPEDIFMYPEHLECAENCPSGAMGVYGDDLSPEELADLILRDLDYYEATEGGVTFSGGEPLLQADGILALLEKLDGIHVAVETSLHAPPENLGVLLDRVDLFIVDVKILTGTPPL